MTSAASTKKRSFVLSIAAVILAGCATSPTATNAKYRKEAENIRQDQEKARTEKDQKAAEAVISKIPDWALSPPKSDNSGIYGVGIASSKKLTTAIKKASLYAQYELAKTYKQEISSYERSYIKTDHQKLTTQQYTQVIDSFVNGVSIAGYKTVRKKVVPIAGEFNAFILLKLPFPGINNIVQEKKPADTKIKAAFEELEKNK